MFLSHVVFLSLFVFVSADYYLDEVEGQCYATNAAFTCAKYRFLKNVDKFSLHDVNLTSDSSVRLVHVPGANGSASLIFPEARGFNGIESEFSKMVKFFQRQTEKFFNVQGLSVELPEEARIIDKESELEIGRGKQKKLIIIPILILFKLFKIKVLTTLILGAVLFIKKILLLAGFILPGVVASIKHHCKAQQVQVVPHYVEENHYQDEEDDFGLSAYGGGSSDKHHYWDRKNRRKHIYV